MPIKNKKYPHISRNLFFLNSKSRGRKITKLIIKKYPSLFKKKKYKKLHTKKKKKNLKIRRS